MFSGLEPEIEQDIHISYRLTYLKETVMAHSLFQEDPTYNFVMQLLHSVNYVILNSLMVNHQQ
jgi:hypothetical protein